MSSYQTMFSLCCDQLLAAFHYAPNINMSQVQYVCRHITNAVIRNHTNAGVLDFENLAPVNQAWWINGLFPAIFTVITLFLNSISVIVLSDSGNRSPTNALLATISAIDLFTCMTQTPSAFHVYLLNGYKRLPTRFWCDEYNYFQNLVPASLHSAAILLNMGVSIQRCVGVRNVRRLKGICSYRGTLFIVVLSCFLSVCVHSIYLATFHVEEVPVLSKQMLATGELRAIRSCRIFPRNFESYLELYSVYLWCRIVLLQVLPALVLCVCNANLILVSCRTFRYRRQLIGSLGVLAHGNPAYVPDSPVTDRTVSLTTTDAHSSRSIRQAVGASLSNEMPMPDPDTGSPRGSKYNKGTFGHLAVDGDDDEDDGNDDDDDDCGGGGGGGDSDGAKGNARKQCTNASSFIKRNDVTNTHQERAPVIPSLEHSMTLANDDERKQTPRFRLVQINPREMCKETNSTCLLSTLSSRQLDGCECDEGRSCAGTINTGVDIELVVRKKRGDYTNIVDSVSRRSNSLSMSSQSPGHEGNDDDDSFSSSCFDSGIKFDKAGHDLMTHTESDDNWTYVPGSCFADDITCGCNEFYCTCSQDISGQLKPENRQNGSEDDQTEMENPKKHWDISTLDKSRLNTLHIRSRRRNNRGTRDYMTEEGTKVKPLDINTNPKSEASKTLDSSCSTDFGTRRELIGGAKDKSHQFTSFGYQGLTESYSFPCSASCRPPKLPHCESIRNTNRKRHSSDSSVVATSSIECKLSASTGTDGLCTSPSPGQCQIVANEHKQNTGQIRQHSSDEGLEPWLGPPAVVIECKQNTGTGRHCNDLESSKQAQSTELARKQSPDTNTHHGHDVSPHNSQNTHYTELNNDENKFAYSTKHSMGASESASYSRTPVDGSNQTHNRYNSQNNRNNNNNNSDDSNNGGCDDNMNSQIQLSSPRAMRTKNENKSTGSSNESTAMAELRPSIMLVLVTSCTLLAELVVTLALTLTFLNSAVYKNNDAVSRDFLSTYIMTSNLLTIFTIPLNFVFFYGLSRQFRNTIKRKARSLWRCAARWKRS